MNKQDVLEMVRHIPGEQIDPEQLMLAIYLKAKLDRAEEDIEEGRVVSHEEVVRRTQQWFK